MAQVNNTSARNHRPGSPPLARFVSALEAVIAEPEERLLPVLTELVGELVAKDDWLAAEHRIPDAARYQQYLLHRDATSRFCVVSFLVWGPGQSTPIHDHGTWGLVGMLCGAETATRFVPHHRWSRGPADRPTVSSAARSTPSLRRSGTSIRSPTPSPTNRPSSIHVYGADIGAVRRHSYQLDGSATPFVSGYSNSVPVDPADGPFANVNDLPDRPRAGDPGSIAGGLGDRPFSMSDPSRFLRPATRCGRPACR